MKKRILVVEDSKTQAEKLRRTLEASGFEVFVAEDGVRGLAAARIAHPDLIISDVVMPNMDGYEMCEQLKQEDDLRHVPLALHTSLSDLEDVIRGLEAGAEYYLTKPYEGEKLVQKVESVLEWQVRPERADPDDGIEVMVSGKKHVVHAERHQILTLLLSTYETAIEHAEQLRKTEAELKEFAEQLEQMVEERTAELHREIQERQQAEDQLRKALEGTVAAIAQTTELRDPYTAGHQRRVARLACAIAVEMGLPEDRIVHLRLAGLLHDIGKVALPAEILTKPTRLSAIEYEIIKEHSQSAFDILSPIAFDPIVAEVVLQHHERLDGTGYPQGLEDEAILKEAAILAVADVVEAMASHRPYRAAVGLEKALEEIARNSGTLYDPEVANACLAVFERGDFSLDEQ